MRREAIGDHELYLGTMEETIEGVKADHVLTDPPYLYIKTHANTGRKYIGSEMKEEYFDIAHERMKAATQGTFAF